MIQRRDLILGLLLLAFFSVIVISALLILTTVAMNGDFVSEKSVAIVEITGPIYTSKYAVEKIERYIKNENVPAIVIRLNTPGGGVAASQEIYETVKKARLAGKKVFASMGSVAASGGYMMACVANKLLAAPFAIIGSVGVLAQLPNFNRLLKKNNIELEH